MILRRMFGSKTYTQLWEFDGSQRDLDHWGWKSNIAAAETIATNLKKQGL